MQNCLMNMLRGTPNARRHLGRWMEKHGRRLPALIPYGRRYLNMRFQYVHVDDVARLLAWILRQQEVGRKLTILNVAGRGDALSFERCAQIAGTKLTRLPGKIGCRMALNLGWKLGISSIPASAVPYFTGTCIMDTSRLQNFLGKDYAQVIRYTCEEALADSFKGQCSPVAAQALEAAASKPNL
jgi:nucleoside-diphosphate-sugar epimerase